MHVVCFMKHDLLLRAYIVDNVDNDALLLHWLLIYSIIIGSYT